MVMDVLSIDRLDDEAIDEHVWLCFSVELFFASLLLISDFFDPLELLILLLIEVASEHVDTVLLFS